VDSSFILWPRVALAVFLVIGLISFRKHLTFKLDQVILLGRVFVAAPLAAFGAEHLAGAKFIMQVVPAWMPGHLFWTYFVGLALLAAATSLVLTKFVRWSAPLLGLMFLLFVLMLHLPNVARNPRDRILWAVALRDLAFAAGGWALAGSLLKSNSLVTVSRLVLALVLVFFGVEHFLHPEFVPGVPLGKVTPEWIPVRALWGYLIGALLLACGVAMLANLRARMAASWLGLAIVLTVVFLYLPILVAASQPSEMNEALNYVADTLLFGGTIWLVAAALPSDRIKAGRAAP
jgi:uncharacterized membrane protein